MHRSNLADINCHLVLAEPGTLPSSDRLVVDLDVGGEQEIASGPATGFKDFRWHSDDVGSFGIEDGQKLPQRQLKNGRLKVRFR